MGKVAQYLQEHLLGVSTGEHMLARWRGVLIERGYLSTGDVLATPAGQRIRLIGTKSNRDGIGGLVRIFHGGTSQSRLVKSGSSYLSQSELPVTFGVGRRDRIDRVVIAWPSGRVDEHKGLATGRAYEITEGSAPK